MADAQPGRIPVAIAAAPPAARWPAWLNLLVPGVSLIAAGRAWTGIAMAAWWGVCAHAAIAGWLLVPDAWPRWITWTATGLMVTCWAAGQRRPRYPAR